MLALVGTLCFLGPQPGRCTSIRACARASMAGSVGAMPSTLREQQAAAEVHELLLKAKLVMEDPEKVKLVAQRIKALFEDEERVAKLQGEVRDFAAALPVETQARRLTASAFAPALRGVTAARAAQVKMTASLHPDQLAKVKMTAAVEKEAEAPEPVFRASEFVQTLPGISAPLGFFDPAGFCADDAGSILPQGEMTEGRVRFYREAEIKHCRVAMLAAVGFPLAEQFHPLFGGVDVPSYIAFQATPLQTFWPVVLLAIAVPEILSIFTFQSPLMDGLTKALGPEFESSFGPADRQPWAINLWKDREAGDFGWDPLGFKPKDPAALRDMQTKELNNGRLAMIGIAGMVMQELATGQKLF